MAQYTLSYPSTLIELNKFRDKLYPSNYPTYKVYQCNKSTSTTTLPEYKKVFFKLYINLDNTFTFNNILYNNTLIVNGRNQFLKTNDYDLSESYILSMFRQNQTLEDFTLSFISRGIDANKFITFYLTSITKGNNVFCEINDTEKLTITGPDYLTYNYSNGLIITNYNVVIGNSINEDVNSYQIGIDLYKLSIDTFIPLTYKKVIINEQIQSGVSQGQFDISYIIKKANEKWKPILKDFSLDVLKYLDYYQIIPYQKYVDNRTDTNNTWPIIYTSNSNVDSLYSIDSTFDLFEFYDNTQYGLSQPDAQLNLDTFTEGTSGTNFYSYNLTKQPRYKELNKGYEILYNTMKLKDGVSEGQLLNDSIHMKFYYSGTNGTETIILNTTETLDKNSLRYINQFSFKSSNLKNIINGDWFDVQKIEVYFTNSAYDNTINVRYETQTYFIDYANQSCYDNTNTELDYTPILFKNSRGAFDIFEFDVIQEINSNRNIQSITNPYTYLSNQYSEFERIYNLKFSKTYTLKSKVLNNEEFNWLKDLIVSQNVFIIDGANLYPIIVANTDYNFINNEDRIISIVFYYSRPENV